MIKKIRSLAATLSLVAFLALAPASYAGCTTHSVTGCINGHCLTISVTIC
jgi:hypothetical protein